jgi:hypothetical protein
VSNPLVAVQFATLAAEMADPDRFRRGRALARQQAVAEVTVARGVAHAQVQGSRADPYAVSVRVRPVRRAAVAAASAGRLNALVPRPEDLTIACSCPDWGDPCKHGVAALVALGEHLAGVPEELARWRGSEGADDAEVAGGTDDTGSPAASSPAPDDPIAVWLGRGYDPDPPAPLAPLPRRGTGGTHDDETAALTAAAVDDARAVLARAFGRR